MSRGLNIPYFAEPPAQYNQQYFSQLVQSFALYARGVANPGPWQATELTLTEEAGNTDRGTMSWNTAEETVDLTMTALFSRLALKLICVLKMTREAR